MNNESVKLDQIVKSLFEVSNKALLGIINECFNKDYMPENVIVERLPSRFIKERLDYEYIEADIVLKINDVKYHIEFQTKNDKTMEIRMFEYAFYLAKGEARIEEDGIMTLYIPNQAVIFVEENAGIRDQKVKIVFPNGKEVLYDIPTIRFWQYSTSILREKKIYNLLPLTIFRYRKTLQKVVDNQDKLLEEKEKLREDIHKLSEQIKFLIDEHQLEGEDVHKIALAITNLTEYLNNKYIKDENLDREVIRMTKTLYDPLVEQKGIEQGIEQGLERGIEQGIRKVVMKMIAKGKSNQEIMEVTDLTEQEIEELRTKAKEGTQC